MEKLTKTILIESIEAEKADLKTIKSIIESIDKNNIYFNVKIVPNGIQYDEFYIDFIGERFETEAEKLERELLAKKIEKAWAEYDLKNKR